MSVAPVWWFVAALATAGLIHRHDAHVSVGDSLSDTFKLVAMMAMVGIALAVVFAVAVLVVGLVNEDALEWFNASREPAGLVFVVLVGLATERLAARYAD